MVSQNVPWFCPVLCCASVSMHPLLWDLYSVGFWDSYCYVNFGLLGDVPTPQPVVTANTFQEAVESKERLENSEVTFRKHCVPPQSQSHTSRSLGVTYLKWSDNFFFFFSTRQVSRVVKHFILGTVRVCAKFSCVLMRNAIDLDLVHIGWLRSQEMWNDP